MNHDQAEQCSRALAATFPRWKPTPDEIQNWAVKVFARMDAEIATEAIGEYFASSRFNSPAPADFKAAYSKLHDRARPAEEVVDNHGYCGLSLVCSEPPPAFPGRARMTIPLMFGSSGKIPQNEQTLWDIAERERRVCEEMYGGRWQIRRDAGDGAYQPEDWTRYAQAGRPGSRPPPTYSAAWTTGSTRPAMTACPWPSSTGHSATP